MVSTQEGLARATTEVTVQPVRRDFLFGAKMTLYLLPEIGAAFRAPVHTVVLGRSQDLAEVLEVKDIVLEKSNRARIEHTLLPRALRPCVRFGATVLLTRHISEPPTREASFAQYIALREHVHLGDGADPNRAFINVANISLNDLWTDTDFRRRSRCITTFEGRPGDAATILGHLAEYFGKETQDDKPHDDRKALLWTG